MNALFVHGMGRTGLSWTPTLVRFRSRGIRTFVFNYSATLHDFSTIAAMLVRELERVSGFGDYVAPY